MMVSRRRILSRSRDDLSAGDLGIQDEEEDVWFSKEKLYKDHIQEVLNKWTQIDDEIWAKVIVFEKNRRVAKAYARAPVLTINGSDDGFDGYRIGLCGFDNPMRHPKTEEVKRHIGNGVKVKMDDQGNILVKRVAKSNVYVKSTSEGEETSIGIDILKLPNGALEMDKPVKLFDMKKFQQNVNRELRRAYPDRRRLECQCLCTVVFVKNDTDILDCPVWVLIVNVVALDMLKAKLPPVKRQPDISTRPRIPIPDEDPYSIAGFGGSSGYGTGNGTSSGYVTGNGMANGTGGGGNGMYRTGLVAATREHLLEQQQRLLQRRNDMPPKLPPRDITYPREIPQPDYDDTDDEKRSKPSTSSSEKEQPKSKKKYDDPYYCGLRARIPNFVKLKTKPKDVMGPGFGSSGHLHHAPLPFHQQAVPYPFHPLHARNCPIRMGGTLIRNEQHHWD